MKAILFIIFSLFFIQIGTAQKFTVIAVGGTAQYSTNKTWIPIKAGTIIPDESLVRIEAGSYLGLAHVNKKVIELKLPGTYIFSSLEKMANIRNTLSDKYYTYVKDKIATGKQANTLSSTGMVERDLGNLMLLPSNQSYVLEDLCLFVWNNERKVSKNMTYQFTITDEGANVLFQKSYQDTFTTINLAELSLQAEHCYYWRVSSGNKGKESCFKVLASPQKQEILAQIQQIEQEFGSSSAMAKVVIANYLDEKNIKTEALLYYHQAAELVPQVESYQILYQAYRNKMGIL